MGGLDGVSMALPAATLLAALTAPAAASPGPVGGGHAQRSGGDAECTWTHNTDYFGNIGNVGVNLTAQQCCDICKRHANCTFAVFGKAGEHPPRSCWLKHGDPQHIGSLKHFYVAGATTCCPKGLVCPAAKPPSAAAPCR